MSAGQLGQRRADLGGGLGAGREREADLGAEPVDQPPQRRGHVRVGAADARVPGLVGRRAVERRVGGAAQQGDGLLEEGGVPGSASGPARRSRAPGPASGRPVDAERGRQEPQPGDVLGPGRREGPQDADAAVEHEPGRAPAGEQGDLRVPPLDRQVAAQRQRPAAAGGRLRPPGRACRARSRPRSAARALQQRADRPAAARAPRAACRRRPAPARPGSRAGRGCGPGPAGGRPVPARRRRRGRSSRGRPGGAGRAAGWRRPR